MMRKVFSFIFDQINQIRKGNLFILLRKISHLFFIPFALLIVLVVRLLRTLLIIRFGPLFSRRIGHFAISTELYLCERQEANEERRTCDIFYYHYGPICNHQLKKMWERRLSVAGFFSPFVYLVDRINSLFPGYEVHKIPIRMENYRDIKGFLGRLPAHLYFTPVEERRGEKALLEMGVPKNAEFVCFHMRDCAYLNNKYPAYDWTYHNYRDSSLHNYLPAIEELTYRGYFVIRMGSIVKEPLNTDNPKIIDYATKYRNDFLDIYLSARCKFFLGSNSGLDDVPKIFRRPIVCVNFVLFEFVPTWSPVRLFILKKVWLPKEKRLLAFQELLGSKDGREERQRYKQLGVDIIENTAEEIRDVVIEMDERLKGRWKDTPEDEELQACFRSILKSSKLHGEIFSRIGAQFLRQNRNLLGDRSIYFISRERVK